MWFDWGCGFGCGVGGGVGVEEVGVPGEGVVGVAVDEEADGGDLGECGVEGSDDRCDGESFDLDAGGVIVDEIAAEVDDGELAGLGVEAGFGFGMRVAEQKDVIDGWTALQGMGGVGERVGGEKVFEESAGAKGGLLGESEGFGGRGDGGVSVVRKVKGDVFGAGGGGGGDGSGVVERGEALVRLLAAVEEESRHEEDAAGEAPKENALVAGDHFGAPAARRARLRQEPMAAAMALAMFCW